jgi:erythronate-4-phosphate dehydrogenase
VRARVEPHFSSTALTELEEMDVISLHVPLTHAGADPTFHFLTKAFLKRQKPDCVLINAARGAVIDSDVLMQHGTHLHWCFDVWEHEPHLSKAILERALIATPHIAGYSLQSKRRGIEMIYSLAKEKGMITSTLPFKSKMPSQQFALQQRHPSWQEVVLEIFNPLLMTDKMRALLLRATDPASLFDEMRHQFNERYEFAFTKIKVASLSEIDKKIMQQWGIQIDAVNA